MESCNICGWKEKDSTVKSGSKQGKWLCFFIFSAKGSPRGLRVFDETVSSMKVSWEPAPGNVLQYRLAYRPSSGGPRHEVSVKGTNTAAVLKKLQPGTEYIISVSARYRSGLGEALNGQGTTLGGEFCCWWSQVTWVCKRTLLITCEWKSRVVFFKMLQRQVFISSFCWCAVPHWSIQSHYTDFI